MRSIIALLALSAPTTTCGELHDVAQDNATFTGPSSRVGAALAAPRIAAIHTHLEGNLGDEMETTPVLDFLTKAGYTVDVFCARWKRDPGQRVSARAVRELAYADEVFTSSPPFGDSPHERRAEAALLSRDYAAVIVMPGPMNAARMLATCKLAHGLRSKPLVVAVGVTISHIPAADSLGWNMSVYNPCSSALVIAREPITARRWTAFVSRKGARTAELDILADTMSADTLAPCPALGSSAVFAGDTSFSFKPSAALMGTWRRHYSDWAHTQFDAGRGRPWRALIFNRNSNKENLRVYKGVVSLRVLTLPSVHSSKSPDRVGAPAVGYNKTKTVRFDATNVVFATSDVDVDRGYLANLVARGIVPATRAILAENVEQMWGLIDTARRAGVLVLSDRYHPAVAAHLLGARVQVIKYSREPQKLNGVNQMLGLPSEKVHDLNARAWRCMHQALATRRRS
ncbi:hypothetical protein T492DRAFT_1097266 [Pavlovales sp. CCMP2436]|nr:hypothetical protein T492DRAFT_1097266 [Pavlovales sp. CCMP2436]